MSSRHREVFVKVNAPVDEGIAEVVRLLSRIPGLETIESCQGYPGERAFVSFQLGGWKAPARFLAVLAPELLDPQEAVIVSARTANGSVPVGRITFRPELMPRVEQVPRRIARAYSKPGLNSRVMGPVGMEPLPLRVMRVAMNDEYFCG